MKKHTLVLFTHCSFSDSVVLSDSTHSTEGVCSSVCLAEHQKPRHMLWPRVTLDYSQTQSKSKGIVMSTSWFELITSLFNCSIILQYLLIAEIMPLLWKCAKKKTTSQWIWSGACNTVKIPISEMYLGSRMWQTTLLFSHFRGLCLFRLSYYAFLWVDLYLIITPGTRLIIIVST